MGTVTIDKSESAGPEGSEATRRQDDGPLSVGRQFTLVSTLAAYSAMLLVGITHHEPWADEAQAWLLSRDLSYHYLVFHQIAYEGHPPLWFTILWIANHWFHLPYQSIGWIGGLCALAGCWFFARYSPFPVFVRVLFPFTYFMVFQYTIVARPYVLLPLCAFSAAHFFADAERRPWRFIAALSALALLSAAGVMIAAGLIAARAWYCLRSWKEIPAQTRKQLLFAAVVFCLVVAFVAFVNWPPSDRSFARFDRPANQDFGLSNLPREISIGLFGSTIPSIVFLVAVGVWCAYRRRFLPFAISMAFVLFFFTKVYGYLWHSGALTVTVITALWIAWPREEKARKHPRFEGALNALVLLGLAGLFAVQIYWTARTLAMDYSRPYSGSLDAANFLHSVGADAATACGFDFHSVAVQPYFRESIYQNWPKGEGFWRLEMGNRNDLNCNWAKWIVVTRSGNFVVANRVFYQQDRSLRSLGYIPVHVSPGSMFFEGRETEPTDFIIYKLP
jgi:hypothetical protein